MANMRRTILATAASALIIYIWGALSWGVFSWHRPSDFKDPEQVARVLKDNAPSHGTYALPSWQKKEGRTPADMAAELKEGPFVWATIRPGKKDLSFAGMQLSQLLTVSLASLTMVFLIQKSRHDAFLDRLSIAVLAGLLLGIMGALPQHNFLESTQTVALFIDGILPWTLAGAAIAAILPTRASASS